MRGIEILTSAQVATGCSFNWDACWLTTAVVLVVWVIFGVISAMEEYDYSFIPIAVIVGVFSGFIVGPLAGGVLCTTPTDYETQYKVTISEEVSMTKFLEHYEVIDQDGKIFTVREKTNESN